MKKLRNFVVAAAATTGLMLGGLTFAAPTANAETTQPTRAETCDTSSEDVDNIHYTYDVCVDASAEASDVAQAHAKARHTADGRLVLSFVMAQGLPQSQQGRCDVIPAGKRYLNNYYDSLGNEHWKWKVAPPGGVKICFDGHVWRVVKCGNKVIWKKPIPPKVRKHIFKGRAKIVQKQQMSAKVKAVAESSSTSTATAVVSSGPCMGSSATGSGTGSASAKAIVTVRAWSKSKLVAIIKATKGELVIQQRNKVTIDAFALAKTRSRSSAKAGIVCNPPETCPPGTTWNDDNGNGVVDEGECDDEPNYTAPSVSASALACVEPGQATGIVTVTATNNNDVAVPATFKFPGKPDQTATIAANATVSKRFTGIAPGSYTGSVSFGAPVNKSAPYSVTVEECDVPTDECPNIPGNQPPGYDCTGPQGRIVGPLHMYEHGTATYRVRGWDNTDGANVEIDVWFTGNVTGSFVDSYTLNGEKVVEFILVAGPDNGTNDHGFIHARITDQDGLEKLLEPHKIFVEPNDTGD